MAGCWPCAYRHHGGIKPLYHQRQVPEEGDETAQTVPQDLPRGLVEHLELFHELGVEGLILLFGQVRLISCCPLQVAVVVQQFVIAFLDELVRPWEQGQQGCQGRQDELL